jgi:hypothetical protein
MNRRQIGKHHTTQFQNNLMLKDRAQKILNLKKKDPKKKLCQPEPTRKTRGLSDRTKIDE